MVIRYEADNHGTLYVTLRSHYPFRKVGDELRLYGMILMNQKI